MVKKFNFEQKYKPKAIIDITPLIDLIFLLVVFFMVTSSLGKISSINVTLPYAENSGNRQISEYVISINEENTIFFNDIEITLEQLSTELQNKKSEIGDSLVVIRGDKKSSYEMIVSVMDSLNKAGISQFTLSTISNR
jgi:biopolymer transport protein ExbD